MQRMNRIRDVIAEVFLRKDGYSMFGSVDAMNKFVEGAGDISCQTTFSCSFEYNLV